MAPGDKKRALMFGALAVLVLLNLWRWFGPAPGSAAKPGRVAVSGPLRVEDFRIATAPADAPLSAPAARDLFAPVVVVVKAPPKPKVIEPPQPPPKTPEQLAEEAARAELAQIKYVAFSLRAGRGQAFLIKGEQSYLVETGGKVAERFVVEQLTAESVRLRDPATNVAGQIGISGK